MFDYFFWNDLNKLIGSDLKLFKMFQLRYRTSHGVDLCICRTSASNLDQVPASPSQILPFLHLSHIFPWLWYQCWKVFFELPPHVCCQRCSQEALIWRASRIVGVIVKPASLWQSRRSLTHMEWDSGTANHKQGCNKMQQDATRCNKMQQDATRCNKMQQDATRCNKMQQETRCNKMQQDATKCNKMQQDATRCNKMQQVSVGN